MTTVDVFAPAASVAAAGVCCRARGTRTGDEPAPTVSTSLSLKRGFDTSSPSERSLAASDTISHSPEAECGSMADEGGSEGGESKKQERASGAG